ncbi:MAG: inorganic pyrophosphatase [Candidatus Latescibacteria bacterium]|nr:inorganic pyrophosphatase [Candidatus Latescibacterota bacterium]
MGLLFKPHPWHGISIGSRAPEQVTVYIEILPTDTLKYEIDKTTGFLTVDRPQQYSNVCPSLYGFVPQTFCAEQVAAFCASKTGREGIVGDGDPLDICVLTEKTIAHSDILLQAVPIGGLRMIDGDEADDKIIAVLAGDAAYGRYREIEDCPAGLVKRLEHYFLTYKQAPDAESPMCEVTHIYGQREAFEVIQRSQEDYRRRFAGLEGLLTTALRG